MKGKTMGNTTTVQHGNIHGEAAQSSKTPERLSQRARRARKRLDRLLSDRATSETGRAKPTDRISLEVFGASFDPRQEARTKAEKEHWRAVDTLALETEALHGLDLSRAWYCAQSSLTRARTDRFWSGDRTKAEASALLPAARGLIAARVVFCQELAAETNNEAPAVDAGAYVGFRLKAAEARARRERSSHLVI